MSDQTQPPIEQPAPVESKNENTLDLMNRVYEQLNDKAFTWVKADLVDYAKPGVDEQSGKPVQGLVVSFNGEKRKYALSGSLIIERVLSQIDIEEKTVMIPWDSTNKRKMKQSEDGTWWIYS